MSDERTPTHYTCDETPEWIRELDLGEAVRAFAETFRPNECPETVTVYGYAPKSTDFDRDKESDYLVDMMFETLFEEHIHPDGGWPEKTPKMKKAAVAFLDTMCDEFTPTVLDCVSSETVKVADYVDVINA